VPVNRGVGTGQGRGEHSEKRENTAKEGIWGEHGAVTREDRGEGIRGRFKRGIGGEPEKKQKNNHGKDQKTNRDPDLQNLMVRREGEGKIAKKGNFKGPS